MGIHEMAEACRVESLHKTETKTTINQDESFCIFNVLCVFISLVTILADLTTDVLVFAEYCKNGNGYWALATLIFILTPNILINIFSLRWFNNDQMSITKHWITHCCLGGLLQRYVIFLHKTFSCQNLNSEKLTIQRNDLSLLHFLYVFTGTMPQIILQTYAVLTFSDNHQTKIFALFASISSVTWGCITYLYSIMTHSNVQFHWISFFLRLLWHAGMLVARVFGILLFTIIFGIWTLLPLGLHWIAMTFWIVIQKTTFCPSKLEESLYNVVMGFVYCFCYVNLREGHTRYRIIIFCMLMVTQNFGSLILYVIVSHFDHQNKTWSITATFCIITGTIVGISAMIIYYRYFHSKGPIAWKYVKEDIELNNKINYSQSDIKLNKTSSLNHVRSFKSTTKQGTDDKPPLKKSPNTEISSTKQNADKKILLDHWVARCGTPTFTSAPVTNNSMECSSIEIYTTENSPQSIDIVSKSYKKITICSPSELRLKINSIENIESSIDDIACGSLNLPKRRGVCFSDEMKDYFTNSNLDDCNVINENYGKNKIDLGSIISHDTDGSNKKTSSDSIDMDLDLSFSDINSSDINTFNENIVQKLCLSALKNIKVGNQDADIENIQRIALDILKEMYTRKDKSKNAINTNTISYKRDLDTPTELLSVHDYENICAVNIAREAWGLRSWNGYGDIENWVHDGSVVRDRRRDTLTSASTEISSCISQDLKNAILSAPTFSKKTPTYANIYIRFDKNNQDDFYNTPLSGDDLFLAKPCVVEAGKDLTHLEPIMEELDDPGDVELKNKKRLNSESSLVATIDEIRKVTATNSPRNLFHRREPLWDSPQLNAQSKIESSLKHALWKEPFKLDSSNILESLSEKENISGFRDMKRDLYKKDLNLGVGSASTNIEYHVQENNFNIRKNTRGRQKSNLLNNKPLSKKNANKHDHLQDLSNTDIDFLWQLVSENSLHLNSSEELGTNKRTSSLQSLIHKEIPIENTPTPKLTNIKKCSKRPRRKFSILREKFEPKTNLQSDKEILCHGSDNNIQNIDDTQLQDFVKLKNEFRCNNEETEINTQDSNDNLSNSINGRKVSGEGSNLGKSIREKRSIFMKQVLSPPKYNTKLRYKM